MFNFLNFILIQKLHLKPAESILEATFLNNFII